MPSEGGLAAIDGAGDAEAYGDVVADLDAVNGDAPVPGDETGDVAPRERERGEDGQRTAGDYRPLDARLSASEEPLPDAEAWRTFSSLTWSHGFAPIRQDLFETFGDCEDAILDGRRPTQRQVRKASEALDMARHLVEEYYEPIVGDGGREGSA